MGTAIIANDGTGDKEWGDYSIVLSKWGRPNDAWRKAKVLRFSRQARGPWDLLYVLLRAAVGSRNPTEQAGPADPADPWGLPPLEPAEEG
jgi:hypothetical protein